jgi:hypothetical protein
MAKKLILSTGNAEEDARKLAELRGDTDTRLENRTTFEEDKEKHRRANEAAASEEPSRNALTDTPHLEGQVIAVVDADEPETAEENAPTQAPATTETEELKHMGVEPTPVVPSTGVVFKTDAPRSRFENKK